MLERACIDNYLIQLMQRRMHIPLAIENAKFAIT